MVDVFSVLMVSKKQEIKSKLRVDISRSLITVSITIFIFILTFKPEILKGSFLLPVQITFSIPLFLTSMFARMRLAYKERPKIWETYEYISFVLGYFLLLNSLGILLSLRINLTIGMMFFAINILISLIYSSILIRENKAKLKSRIIKDSFFIIITLFGGILPSLSLY